MKIDLNENATSAIWAIAVMVIFLSFASCESKIKTLTKPCIEEQADKK